MKTFIHVSALSADLESESRWSRTKAMGEIAVREEFPEAIIIKPNVLFGREDRFLNRIGTALSLPAASLYGYNIINGGVNLVQPVHAPDVAQAMKQIIYNYREFEGKTFQLSGPEDYSHKEIVEFVADITCRNTHLFDISEQNARLKGRFIEQLINPIWTTDMLDQMLEDNVFRPDTDMMSFDDLNITPGSMERLAFDYLHRFRVGGHFARADGYH